MARSTRCRKIYTNGSVYLYGHSKFIYEVVNYKVYKDRYELVGSKTYASDRPLPQKATKYKRKDNYTLIKEIEWIAAPKSYLEQNGFTEWHR